jgi:heme exporter protein B
MTIWTRIVQRDLRIALRRRSDALSSLFFFVIVVSLFPLGVGPEPATLRLLASGVLWVAALLATLLSLGRLFAADHLDGTLEQMLLAAEPLWLVVTGKVFAHWLTSGLPLVLLSPLMGLQFGLEGDEIAVLSGALLLGTPVLSLIGSIGAALTVGLRAGSVLLALLVLPLYIPVLVFGAAASGAFASGLAVTPHFSILGALLLASLALAPLAAALALRISLE